MGGVVDLDYNFGYEYEYEHESSVEVVSPTGDLLPFTVPPLPAPRSQHTQDGELACGGGEYGTGTKTSCVSLTASGWITSQHLVKERNGHVSWSSPDGLLLMGGSASPQTTELLTNTSSSRRLSNRDNTESPYQTSSSSFNLEYDTM